MANLRDRRGTVQNQPNITKIVKHGKKEDNQGKTATAAVKPK